MPSEFFRGQVVTLFLEWGDDFHLTNNGSLQLANGWDGVRQRIERRLLTNPQTVLPDGTPVAADYIFHLDYGEGVPLYVGQNINEQWMGQMRKSVLQGVRVDDAVLQGSVPTVQFIVTKSHEVYMVIGIQLRSGEPGTIAVQLQ